MLIRYKVTIDKHSNWVTRFHVGTLDFYFGGPNVEYRQGERYFDKHTGLTENTEHFIVTLQSTGTAKVTEFLLTNTDGFRFKEIA